MGDLRLWRRRGFALAVSLGLHAVLFGHLLRAPSRPPPQRTAPVEVTLIEIPPAPAAPSPASPPEPPASRRPSQAPPPSKAAPTAPPVTEAPVADAPRAAADVPTADLPAGTRGGLPVPSYEKLPMDLPEPSEAAPSGPQAPKVEQDLVGSIVRDSISRGKVDRGLVHPYYSDLGKALLKNWDADRAVSRKGLKGFGEQFVENSQAWNKIWLERASTFGRSGSPLEDDASDVPTRGPPPSADPTRGPVSLQQRQAMRRQMREQFKSTRRATLRVVQDREGALLSVELVSPSNDAQVDREAVADVRKAASQLPPPPPEVLGSRERIISLWQFELVISINPPVPTFSFEFDEALQFIDPRLPLDRRIYKRVRLLAAE